MYVYVCIYKYIIYNIHRFVYTERDTFKKKNCLLHA